MNEILNPTKRAKNKISLFSILIHVCMNTYIGKTKFKNFHTLLDKRYISTIFTGKMMEKIKIKRYFTMKSCFYCFVHVQNLREMFLVLLNLSWNDVLVILGKFFVE